MVIVAAVLCKALTGLQAAAASTAASAESFSSDATTFSFFQATLNHRVTVTTCRYYIKKINQIKTCDKRNYCNKSFTFVNSA